MPPKKKELNYESDLSIDEHHLDKEWLEQSKLSMQYSKASAMADRKAKKAKEAVKQLIAELTLYGMENSDEIGVKPTKDNVDAWVKTREEYKEAMQEQFDAEYEAEVTKGAVFAFNQRKGALEHLVHLFSMSYFSRPEGMDKITTADFRTKKVKDRMKRRRE